MAEEVLEVSQLPEIVKMANDIIRSQNAEIAKFKELLENHQYVSMRSQKLDALRGIAVISMIAFHTHYILLHLFGYTGIDFPNLFWYILGRVAVIIFIFVAGISF